MTVFAFALDAGKERAMAARRMFSTAVMETDAFLDLPDKAKTLYFYLCMNADDDGFVGAPKKVMRIAKSTEAALRLLVDQGWIIWFDSGVVVITDWRLHNTLQNDRYKETIYKKELAMLRQDENGRYVLRENSLETECLQPVSDPETECIQTASKPETGCIQSVSNPETQHNITKQNKTEQNKTSKREDAPAPAGGVKKSHGEFGWVKLTDAEHDELCREMGQTELKRCIAYVDESAQATGNKNQWRDWNVILRKCHREGWGRGRECKPKLPPAERPRVPGAVYL